MNIELPLTEQEAWDLAQLAKRFSYYDAVNNAANDNEGKHPANNRIDPT